ncbi:MAG: CoA transferase [Rhodobacteraceae bacterium]|nr:CoA transferase [Paracoccaceae bacterium]PHR55657.1 MAG: carnitine dehydratase [Robiginitomaculum sp.]
MSGALAGVKIIELVGLGPAPFAAMMLADHGADVLRIHPKTARASVATMNTPADVLARSRPSIALDLKSPKGCEALLELVAGADGFIEGFRPGVAERLGVGPDICLARNPALAYGRMTGWGQHGPLASSAGHDINYIALTGVLAAIGPAERPIPPLNLLGDFGGGGMVLAFGMLAAILSARRTGHGQVIDAAMTDGTSILAAMTHGFRAGGVWPAAREGNFLDGGAFYYGTYACADGGFVAVGSIEPQFLATLLAGLGLNPADFEPQDDPSHWPNQRAKVAAAFATKPRDYWAALFENEDACVTPVLNWDEAQCHPHNVAREMFVTVGDVPQPAPAPRFSATPAAKPQAPTPPDGDAAAALRKWGLQTDKIARLQAAGAL